MKQIVIFIFSIIILSGLYSHAQFNANVPYIREGVEWGYYWEEIPYLNAPVYSRNWYRAQFRGDTTILGVKFYKYYQYKAPSVDLDTCKFDYLIGQEVIDDKTYIFVMRDGDIRLGSPKRSLSKAQYPIFLQFFNPTHVYDAVEDTVSIAPQWKWFNEPGRKFKRGEDVILLNREKRSTYLCYNSQTGTVYPNEVFYEGIGVVHMDGLGQYGFPTHPYLWTLINGCANVGNILYERDLSTGELVYKSPSFDKYAYGDPTIGGDGLGCVNNNAAAISVNDRLVTAEGSALTAYSLDGRVVAQGVGAVTLPTAGAYIVRTASGASRKVMVQ